MRKEVHNPLLDSRDDMEGGEKNGLNGLNLSIQNVILEKLKQKINYQNNYIQDLLSLLQMKDCEINSLRGQLV